MKSIKCGMPARAAMGLFCMLCGVAAFAPIPAAHAAPLPTEVLYFGSWSGATSYPVGAVVYYQGSSYVNTAPRNRANAPGSALSVWAPFAAQGLVGASGPPGPPGSGGGGNGSGNTAKQTALLQWYRIVPVGTNPQAVAFDGTHIWVANFGGNSVQRL